MMATMATNNGTSLAIVVMMLMLAASFTPRQTSAQHTQTISEAPITDTRLLPSPNTGKKNDRLANSSVV